MKLRRPVARKVGPATSKRAASKIRSTNQVEVLDRIRKIGPCTCEELILSLKEDLAPGLTLREDPISGYFNLLCLAGRIAPTGKTGVNTSGQKAMLWRATTREEHKFLRAFVGPDKKAPWCSGDTLFEFDEVFAAVGEAVRQSDNRKLKKLWRRYQKGLLFKVVLKDEGITKFMKEFDENGRPR